MRAQRDLTVLVVVLGLAIGCTSGGGSSPATDAGDPGDGDEGSDGPDDEVCPASPCSVQEQCGCPPGDACDLDPAQLASGAARCRVAVPVGGKEDESCTTSEECAIGYTCTGASRCRQFCWDDADCDQAEHCIHPVQYEDPDGTIGNVPGVEVCTTACKPDANDGCPQDRVCRLIRSSSTVVENFWYTDCRPNAPATAGQGEPCAGDDDCQPGFDCSKVDFVCRRICILQSGGGTPADCPGETTCQAYAPPAVLGGIEYGACD